jgi:hypothetical protein
MVVARPPAPVGAMGILVAGRCRRDRRARRLRRAQQQQLAGAKAAAQETEQARVVVGQDQAPHTATLSAGADARTRVTAAVRANIRHRLKQGTIEGQLDSVGCRQSGRQGAKLGFHCTAVVSHARYPYLAVVDPAARKLVYCKRDLPPIPSENIPVSARCRLAKS